MPCCSILPGLPEEERQAAAAAYVERRGAALDVKVRAEILEETFSCALRSTIFRAFCTRLARRGFRSSPGSTAQPKKDPPLEITGQIDRLVITDNAVLIVDYKTNRPPPDREEDVAPAYVAQLAAYRAGIREIFPEKEVRAALLWTDSARLMQISDASLDAAEAQFRGPPVPPLDRGGGGPYVPTRFMVARRGTWARLTRRTLSQGELE